jgi:integrase
MNTALKVTQREDVNVKKDYINKYIQNEPKYGVLFTDFVYLTASKKAKRIGAGYINGYNTLIYNINAFSLANNASIYTNSVNESFLDDFIIFLMERDLKQNYIRTLVDMVKSMAKRASLGGYAIDTSYENSEVELEDIFSVYLSMNEITRIYYYKGLTKKQERIKDLFVVGCLTALRYSDYSTLTKANFQNGRIVKVTKKTNTRVVIPLHDYVKEIYAKYDGDIASALSTQHFNRYIKKICKTIGFNKEVTFNYTRGGKLLTETKEKWEMISSHTARRSAATNMYLSGHFKIYEIMQITGHTTEKSFMRYIKITQEDSVNQISGDSFFKL